MAQPPVPATQALFPPSLLSSLAPSASPSSSASFSLPEGYTIRPLLPSDSTSGLLDVLRVLTTVGDISEQRFKERFEYMRRVNAAGAEGGAGARERGGGGGEGEGSGGTYHVVVVQDGDGRIVGTGAVVVERKFIHDLGLVGHIEDISVAKDQQGKKLGLRIIQALDHVAEKVGCYKSILDCSEANEGFYVKCGYKRAGLEMAHYYDGKTSKDMPS